MPSCTDLCRLMTPWRSLARSFAARYDRIEFTSRNTRRIARLAVSVRRGMPAGQHRRFGSSRDAHRQSLSMSEIALDHFKCNATAKKVGPVKLTERRFVLDV